ncbi:hypothetical protein AOLI_G00281900 [Acnodon oligacanthus]
MRVTELRRLQPEKSGFRSDPTAGRPPPGPRRGAFHASDPTTQFAMTIFSTLYAPSRRASAQGAALPDPSVVAGNEPVRPAFDAVTANRTAARDGPGCPARPSAQAGRGAELRVAAERGGSAL